MDLEDNIAQSWKRSLLRMLGMVAGLALLAGASMAFIFFVAKTFGQGERKQQLPVFIDMTSPAPEQQNARTRSAPSTMWPDNPGRGAAVSFTGGRNEGSRVRGGEGPANSPTANAPEKPAPPVGISVEEYRETVESGKKVYLPNPQGECDVGGKSLSALDSCFAKQAAR